METSLKKQLPKVIAFNLLITSNLFALDMTQIQQMIQQRLQAQGMGGNIPMYNMQQSISPTQPLQIISQDDLTKKIESLGLSKSFVIFDKRKDGFSINGKAYIDPEGKIIKYGYDGTTGLATYMTEVTQGQYTIKTIQATADKEAVEIARASHQGETWDVMSATGKRITGNAIAIGSNGFTVSRDSSAITFNTISGLKTVALPNGYMVAEYQNGDATQTGYILLEAIPSNDENGKLLSSFKALGTSLGMVKKNDYVLFNLQNEKMILLNIANDGKSKSECIQGERINSFAYKCNKSFSYETLYDPSTGLPNSSHYYWRIAWVNPPSKKPFSISVENGVKQLIGTDLTTGKRVLLKERIMGINQFKVIQNKDGKISIDVQLGFSNETINDIENLIETTSVMQEG